LYRFYIDESGVDTLVEDPKKRHFGSDWFTTGGLIVDDENIERFEDAHDSIIRSHFTNRGIKLPDKFKLHYSALRQSKWPYNELSDTERHGIADDVFDAINDIDCVLVSASINKAAHARKYTHPAGVRAYTLLACLERFQFFLEDVNDDGIAYYEEFTNSMRRKCTAEMEALRSVTNFHRTLGKIKGRVINGKPTKDIVLQFSDFFVYAPHIKFVTNHAKQQRWEQIRHKYYACKSIWKRNGFVRLK